ncbi:MAG: CRISPR-associated protein Cas4 [Ignisphaera sp.]|nr:CRISPR-associated protein Cas4 [Ignisphaera sp.]MCX8168123.1 CRISPR-associated protein Cas4 [Ignisphaera sp.]MDW8085442.1 CRISPR-associated protein Cas4 [Ignisphaera sp.]
MIENEFNITNLLYSWKVAEAKKRLEEKLRNEIYVTDLIYCPLKYKYQKLYKELALGTAFSPITLYGEIIHQGLERLLQLLFGMDNIKVEVEYEKSVRTNLDNNTYIIKGRVDAIVKDYIIEIKSSSSDKNLPHEHHITQARLYLWLSNLNKALLIYITPSRIVEFQVKGAVSDEELIKLVETVITGRPAPRYSWECRYCTYSILCPQKITSA